MDVSSETNSPDRVEKPTPKLALRILTWLTVVLVGYALPATFGRIEFRHIVQDCPENGGDATGRALDAPDSIAPAQSVGPFHREPCLEKSATAALQKTRSDDRPLPDRKPSAATNVAAPAHTRSERPSAAASQVSSSSVLSELVRSAERNRASPARPAASPAVKAVLVVPPEAPAYVPAYAIHRSIIGSKDQRGPIQDIPVKRTATNPGSAADGKLEPRVAVNRVLRRTVLAVPAERPDALPAYALCSSIATVRPRSLPLRTTTSTPRDFKDAGRALAKPVAKALGAGPPATVGQSEQVGSGLAALPESFDLRPAQAIRRSMATSQQKPPPVPAAPSEPAEQKTVEPPTLRPTDEPRIVFPTAMDEPAALNQLTQPEVVDVERPPRADAILPVAAVEQQEPSAGPQSTGRKTGNSRANPEAEGADGAIPVFESRPITSLTVNIGHKPGATPRDVGREQLTRMQAEAAGGIFTRSWPTVCFEWESPALAHRPLYFEEVNLERYGYGMKYVRIAQPIISAGQFFTTVPILPYKAMAEPAREPVYTLGHYRPGSDAPYCPVYPPLSVSGGVAEAGVAAGMIFLIP